MLKRQRTRPEHLKVAAAVAAVALILVCMASSVHASSRAADPYAVGSYSSFDDDFMFEDDDMMMLMEDEEEDYNNDSPVVTPPPAPAASKAEPVQDNDDWWMDPLSVFDEEAEPAATDLEQSPPVRAPSPQSTTNNYASQTSTTTTVPSAEDDDDFDSYLDELLMTEDDGTAVPPSPKVVDDKNEPPIVQQPPASSSIADEFDKVMNDNMGDDDYWMQDFENDIDNNFDSPSPPVEPEPAKTKPSSPTPSTSNNVKKVPAPGQPRADTFYDPVAPVPAPQSKKNFLAAPRKLFGRRFGAPRHNQKKKRQTTWGGNRDDEDESSSLYPVGVVSTGATAALAATMGRWLPGLSGLVTSGYPAAVAVVAITLGKAVVFFTKKSNAEEKSSNTGNAQSIDSYQNKKKKFEVEDDEDEIDLDDDEVDEEQVEYDAAGEPIRKVTKPVRTPKLDNLERSSVDGGSSSWLGSFVKNSSKSLGLDQPLKNSRENVNDLRKRCEQAELDKANMEREYEKTSWELQETQTELQSLKASTRHLQSQITDNEEMLDRVVKTERRRAKEELLRMKEAMVQVVDKEREAMRSEFMRQAAELQMAWRKEKDYAESEASSSYARPKRYS